MAAGLVTPSGGKEGEQCNAAPELIHAPSTCNSRANSRQRIYKRGKARAPAPDYRFRRTRTVPVAEPMKKAQSLKFKGESKWKVLAQLTFHHCTLSSALSAKMPDVEVVLVADELDQFFVRTEPPVDAH